MMSVRLIPLLAIAASAQNTVNLGIADLLGKQGSGPQSKQTGVAASPVPNSPASPTLAKNPLAVLSSLAAPMAAAGGASQGPLSGGALSQESMAVVSGLVESFMHKVKLEPGERSCLETNVRQVSGDIMGTVGDVVTTVKALIAGKGTVQKKATGSLISAGLDAAMKITSLVTSSMQLIKNCVHGDALVLMKLTTKHLINGTYLEDRFIVNGVDIARSLSDSIVAFDSHDFHRFGSDIGLALRKILLSNSEKATRLPEGMPKQQIIQQATDGLMQGFFAPGSGIVITDKAHPDVDIEIDLHQCIAGNSAFFKELWLAAWNLIAQLSMNGHQHGLGNPLQAQNGRQPKWEGELMVAMMQFPTALSNCGVAEDVQTMFMEAVQSLNDVHVKVLMPHDKFAANNAADDMAKAVEAWTKWNFKVFGYELGKLLRELVMVALPQKYSVDASGRLRRYTESHAPIAHKLASTPASLVIIGGAVISAIAGFAIVRTRRSISRLQVESAELVSDVEGGSEECELGE